MNLNNFILVRNQRNRLVLTKEHEEVEVQAFLCFPWTQPDKLISLCDDKGYEHILIEDLAHLPDNSRILLKEELEKQYFVPRILTIFKLKEEKELFTWHVDTDAGLRSFLTNRREQFRTMMNGSVIIRDICNDIYMVQNPKSLDPKSLKLLWVYLD